MKLKLDEEKMCGLKAKRKHVDEDVLFVEREADKLTEDKGKLIKCTMAKTAKDKKTSLWSMDIADEMEHLKYNL